MLTVLLLVFLRTYEKHFALCDSFLLWVCLQALSYMFRKWLRKVLIPVVDVSKGRTYHSKKICYGGEYGLHCSQTKYQITKGINSFFDISSKTRQLRTY